MQLGPVIPRLSTFAATALLFGFLLSGCDRDPPRDVQAQRGEVDEELNRLTDPAYGSTELRRLVLERMTVRGEFVALRALVSSEDVHVVPVSTPWTIRCGSYSGITISFGASGAEDASGVSVQVASARPSAEQCVPIGLSLATVVRSVLTEAR